MQLTQDLILTLIGSAGTGATMAYLSSRIVSAELWGHIKKHCSEIAGLERKQQNDVDALHRRLDGYSKRLGENERKVAVLLDRDEHPRQR